MNKINVNEIDGKISISIIDVEENKEYYWNIKIDNKKIKVVTLGPILILNKDNSKLFKQAKHILINNILYK